jgi:hypothetical protein
LSSRSSSQCSVTSFIQSFKQVSVTTKKFNQISTTTTVPEPSNSTSEVNPREVAQSKLSPTNIPYPIKGPMTFFKTERGGLNLCMLGFKYQKSKKKNKGGMVWRCAEFRNKSVKCPIILYTSDNQGDDGRPNIEFEKSTNHHNHAPDLNKLVVEKFKSDLKEKTKSPNLPPSIATYNQLAITMNLTTVQMSQWPHFDSIRK